MFGVAIPLSLVTLLWVKVTLDAWQLQVIIADYESVYGRADPVSVPVFDPFWALHDQLIAVGADYFYPFGPLVLVAVGFLWIGLAAMLASCRHAVRNMLIVAGLLVIAVQQWLFGQPLLTYTDVTT